MSEKQDIDMFISSEEMGKVSIPSPTGSKVVMPGRSRPSEKRTVSRGLNVTAFFQNSVGRSGKLGAAIEASGLFDVEKTKKGRRRYVPNSISSPYVIHEGKGVNIDVDIMPQTVLQEWVDRVDKEYMILAYIGEIDKIDADVRIRIANYIRAKDVAPTREKMAYFRTEAIKNLRSRGKS